VLRCQLQCWNHAVLLTCCRRLLHYHLRLLHCQLQAEPTCKLPRWVCQCLQQQQQQQQQWRLSCRLLWLLGDLVGQKQLLRCELLRLLLCQLQ
jgi:hypothetical protein